MDKWYHDNLYRSLIQSKKYTEVKITCEHPRIIINPCFNELLWRYKTLCQVSSDGYVSKVRYYGGRVAYFTGSVMVSLKGVDYDNYQDTYILDEESGETFPVYLLVPCNHCSLCEKMRRDAMSHRCVLESLFYKFLPWFTTLTYAPKYLPSDGVNVRHLQLFLKRFRINLQRSGYSDLVRYYAVSEYTPKGRAHYHVIFWNLHPDKNLSYYKIFRILQDSWSMGFVYNLVVGGNRSKYKSSPDKCFDYVSKYVGKGCKVPEGKNNTFVLSSNRHGGISAPFLDKYVIPSLRLSLNTDFRYFNHFVPGGSADKLFFHRYILNRCFPTFSSSIPLKLRNAYKRLLIADARLHHEYRQECFSQIKVSISDYLPSPLINACDVPEKGAPSFDSVCTHCWAEKYAFDSSVEIIEKLLPKCDFPRAQLLHLKRQLFIGKMFRDKKPRDLADIVYKYRKYKDSLESRLTELL